MKGLFSSSDGDEKMKIKFVFELRVWKSMRAEWIQEKKRTELIN